MTATAQERESVPVQVDCPACGLDFDPVGDRSEAQHLAGVHSDLHHGGSSVAAAVVVDSDRAGLVAVSGLGWLLSPQVYADAQAHATPYAGDQTATERAWSARVDAAVAGMDVLDPAGLDEWMATHADSPAPHLVEAGLVAAWETHIRSLYDTAEPGGLADQHDLPPNTTGDDRSISAADATLVVEDVDEYAL